MTGESNKGRSTCVEGVLAIILRKAAGVFLIEFRFCGDTDRSNNGSRISCDSWE